MMNAQPERIAPIQHLEIATCPSDSSSLAGSLKDELGARSYAVSDDDSSAPGSGKRLRNKRPKRQQLRLTGATQLLELALDELAESVIIFDRDGHILRSNTSDRAILGYDSRFTELTSSLEDRALWLKGCDEHGQPITGDQGPFARILRGETLHGADAMNVTLHTLDGRDIQVRISGAPLRDANGALVGGIAVTRDVTEQLSRERELSAENQRMHEFLAIAAHDLRTPLTANKGYIQLAVKRLQKLLTLTAAVAPALEEHIMALRVNLHEAEQSAQRLAQLTDRVLEVEAIQANKFEILPEAVDLAAIIRTKVHEQRLVTPARAIRYRVLPIGTVPAIADGERIGQVVLNYLTNAVKYSPDNSVIEIMLNTHDGNAHVSVRDTGSGIPGTEQERIWKGFERLADRRRSEPMAGLGLGLYISRAIVEAHGGQVGVESEVGHGSTFWFDLPLIR
jgi:signal transduction histidine kinase